jgi:WhiB family redox-sensing transcriptional regulator
MALSVKTNEVLRYIVDDELYETRACNGLDPDIFFPEFENTAKESYRQEVVNMAVAICLRCPIREICLESALANDEKSGIWGGVYLDAYFKRTRSHNN